MIPVMRLTATILSFVFAVSAALAAEPAGRGERAGPECPGGSRKEGFTSAHNRRSPADTFRELLAMPPAARKQALGEKSDHYRKYLEGRLKEYEQLSLQERELRLRMVDLRWHLLPLMQMPPEQRAERLAAVPEEDRPLVAARLQAWDQLNAEVQKELLENQRALDYFARLEGTTPAQKETILGAFSEDRRARLEADLEYLRGLPKQTRERMFANFNQFFRLNELEQGKILATLPRSVRAQTEKTLAAFEKLPAEERRRCMDSFHKFSNLSRAEREQFFVNAERWQAMSPEEREQWRNLVSKLPPLPPLPPGLVQPPLPPGSNMLSPPPLPPLPPVPGRE
jgi:hypothetical protein